MRVLCHEKVLAADLKGRQCHASHLLPMKDGSVLCVWFEGTREGENDVCIFGAHRGKDGTWSPSCRLTEDDGVPHWNPVLFQRDENTVQLYFKKGTTIARWYTMVQQSHDGGFTFGPARELVQGNVGGRGPVRNKILRLSSGRLLAPASDEDCLWQAFIDISDDGENWRMSKWANLFPGREGDETMLRRGLIQPTLWQDDKGHVHALMRSSEGFIYRMDSQDAGESWTEAYATPFPNNNSGIDLDKLPDGSLWLCCNPVSDNWGARNPLSLFISRDNGGHFDKVMDLSLEEGRHEFSYPCVIAVGNTLHISYTHDRVNIDYWQIEV